MIRFLLELAAMLHRDHMWVWIEHRTPSGGWIAPAKYAGRVCRACGRKEEYLHPEFINEEAFKKLAPMPAGWWSREWAEREAYGPYPPSVNGEAIKIAN